MKKFLIILFSLIIILAILLGIKIYNNKDNTIVDSAINKAQTEKIEEKQAQIYNGNQRPIAVMIDNVGSARPQVGLNDAYIVYEIIVEGKQTRLMALFKNKDLERIRTSKKFKTLFLRLCY